MIQPQISDPEVRLLADIAKSLQSAYIPDMEDWQGSPFRWMKQPIASRRVGTVFEQLVSEWCRQKGFSVSDAPNPQSDRIIGGLRAEIKGSTLWKGGKFRFQQIRDQEYDIAICLGIRPFDAQCWVIQKDILMQFPEGVGIQHGGQAGTDTAWLTVDADNPPRWLRQWGGRLSEAHQVLRKLTAG